MLNKEPKTHNRPKVALVTHNDHPTITPPLGLMCISTALERAGYATDIYDFSLKNNSKEVLLRKIINHEYLWVGLTAMTPSIPRIKDILDDIRKIDNSVPVIIGGSHASALPCETLAELDVDAVCVGDGTDASVSISDNILKGEPNLDRIGNVVPRGCEDITSKKKTHSADAEKAFPRPNWEKINIDDYQSCPMQYIRKGKRVTSIIITKGCPNSCQFCAKQALYGNLFIKRDIKDVGDEVEYLVKERGVDEIHIMDDAFNADIEYAKNILRDWRCRKLKFYWKATHGLCVGRYDDEWLSLLKETGCYQVGFGLESGSDDILRNVDKHVNLDEVQHVIDNYKKNGITTFGFFILGLPGENRNTIAHTIEYACRLSLDNIHVSLFTPYPGSPLYIKAAAEGKMTNDWAGYGHYHRSQGFVMCDLPIEELRRALLLFYVRFYSRPRRALNLLNAMRTSGIMGFIRIARKVF